VVEHLVANENVARSNRVTRSLAKKTKKQQENNKKTTSQKKKY
jgi:hypothetical protein